MSERTWKLPGADLVGPLIHCASKTLDFLERNAVVLGATTAVLLIAVGVLRQRRQTSALRQRTGYDLLPTTDFDPPPEEIHRFARQLQRTRLAAPGWTPRRAAAVRIRLHTTAAGRLAYRVEGHARAASALSQQAYAAVELRAVDPPAEPGGSAAAPPSADDQPIQDTPPIEDAQ